MASRSSDVRFDSECQCEIEKYKLLSAPLYVKTRTIEDGRQYTAPVLRAPNEYKCLTYLTLIVFRTPLSPDQIFKKVFPLATPLRLVKRNLAKLLNISESNILLAKGREVLEDNILVSDIKTDCMGYIELNVFPKDTTKIVFAKISKESLLEEISSDTTGQPHYLPEIITIKFTIPPQNQTFTMAFPPNIKFFEVKSDLAGIFRDEALNLMLLRKGKPIEDKMFLRDIDYDNYGVVEIELFTRNSKPFKLDRLFKLYKYDSPSDVITVSVTDGDVVKNITVEIINDPMVKPYLGGFKSTVSGLVYHHAYTQTPPRAEKIPPEQKNCRSTQTAEEKEILYDTPYERPTQMSHTGVFIPNVTDRVISSKTYETYDEMMARLNHKHYASIIQRAYRKYVFRKQVRAWLKDCLEKIRRMREEERAEKVIDDSRFRMDLITKTYPRTREDFDQLYAMVDRWKSSEIARISALHSKGPRVAEMNLLLDKEVELLRCIEAYRVKLREDHQKIKRQKFLEEISKPITWYGYKNKVISMDTIGVQRARDMKAVYEAYLKYDVKPEDRMELLIHLKLAIEEFYHPLTNEISSLLDRECELMVRNCNDKDLEFLRKRLSGCLFQFIKTSELNEGVTRYVDEHKYGSIQNGKLSVCEMCGICKTQNDFPIHTKTTKMTVCKSCSWKNITSLTWVDMTPIKFILRAVQRDERRRKCWTSIAFILQEKDVYYLVEKLWHSHSAISECRDLTDLRLCRWKVKHDWTPWNCFLVTTNEMKAHLKLENPEGVYDEELVQKIKNKHLLAKGYFENVIKVNQEYTETGKWHKVRATAVDRVDNDGMPPVGDPYEDWINLRNHFDRAFAIH